MKIKKLAKMPYAQAYVEYTDESNFTLVSYRTRVCEYKNNVLKVNGLYSMTTRKHIGAFMSEYFNQTYQLAKSLYENRESMNMETGEIFK